MSKLYPRRRDVRARLLALHHVLAYVARVFEEEYAIDMYGEPYRKVNDYNYPFLSDVRNFLRAGDSLEEAVLAAAEEDEIPDYVTEGPDYPMGCDTIEEHRVPERRRPSCTRFDFEQ